MYNDIRERLKSYFETGDKPTQDQFAELISNSLYSIENILYQDLVSLRGNYSLVPGQFYRITDYITTTSKEYTLSAGHQFDVIVLALTNDTLAERAWAYHHDGDTYFQNSHLEAWQLWYCLDNDTSRFDWAIPASSGGKGVIYRMIDENNNNCPYDFKNILFVRDGLNYYTFSKELSSDDSITDLSVSSQCWNNLIKSSKLNSLQTLSSNIFYQTDTTNCYNNELGHNCWGNFFRRGCYGNRLGDYCYNNTFGYRCYGNILMGSCSGNTIGDFSYFNVFHEGCLGNVLGNNCFDNTFESGCSYNTLLENCSKNEFKNGATSNELGSGCTAIWVGLGCSKNQFGNNCNNNKLQGSCKENVFGNNCYHNILGLYCLGNLFGNETRNCTLNNYCLYNTFGISIDEPRHYYRYIELGNGVQYTILSNEQTASSSNRVQNYRVASGVVGNSSSPIIIEVSRGNRQTLIDVAKDSLGEIKQFCLADIIL